MSGRPLRVAHVVGAMNRAGVETWLMNVARRTDPQVVELTFVKHSPEPGHYDDEIRRLGHKTVVCAGTRRPLRYARTFRKLLEGPQGRFDAVHAHVGNFSALPLAVAWGARIPVRVAHSHSDSRYAQASASLPRRAYLAATRAVIRSAATLGLASSEEACLSLYRRGAVRGGKFQVMPTGIDLDPFTGPSAGLRTELALDEATLVVGHIGRFMPVKNHRFLVAIAAELKRLGCDARLVLVGEGPLRAQVEADVRAAGLADVVLFLGVREDVAQLFATFDVFLLPSLYEGVPITLLEAQASNCPCLISSRISEAVDVVPNLINRRPIEEAPSEWATACVRLGRQARTEAAAAAALRAMQTSEYNVKTSLRRLYRIWSGGSELG